jgi:penicillin-insensitive murein DD-endopeptidase
MHSAKNNMSRFIAVILLIAACCIAPASEATAATQSGISHPVAAKTTAAKPKIRKKKRIKVSKTKSRRTSTSQIAAPANSATDTSNAIQVATPEAVQTGSTIAAGAAQLQQGTTTIRPTNAAPIPVKQTANDRRAAKWVFGSKRMPANLAPRAIGSYARGCLSGGKALAVNGDNWQVMRLSRNRNWGHPDLIKLVERLARDAKKDGWNGLMVGDLAQPRGGPMTSGHASHQIGLDADVWLMQMPARTLSFSERETISPKEVTKSRTQINKSVWTEQHAKLIQRAAKYSEVARIFVHPPIKAELCKWATGDRNWLAKVRPYYGHNYHFHIRMKCPPGFAGCKDQAPAVPVDGTGCGTELAYWMGQLPWRRKAPDPNAKPPKPAPAITLSSLPTECRAVANAP